MSEHSEYDAGSQSVNLACHIVSPEAVSCLPRSNAQRFQIVPLAVRESMAGKVLVIAAAKPLNSDEQHRIIRHLGSDLQLQILTADTSQIMPALRKCYEYEHTLSALLRSFPDTHPVDQEAEAGNPYFIHLLEALMQHADRLGASDIHLSPTAHNLNVRFRLDGILESVVDLPVRAVGIFTVRLKVLGALDIAETRRPQDGQFQQLIDGRSVEFRLSFFPTVDGEKIVLRRICHLQKPTLSSLAFDDDARQRLGRFIQQPDGLILVCGPTGSGKSSTLLALLQEKDVESMNIMTLEDPVEHRIEGIAQSSVEPERSFDYAHAVRAILRQDPDVLMIGEIRDKASCQMALRAVTTGHQVLSTIHAASAHAAITRLRDFGAPPQVLAGCLKLIIGQRLLRCLCPRCAGSGCEDCRHRGYQGRRAVIEMLEFSPAIIPLIAAERSIEEIERVSRSLGFSDMRQDAERWLDAGCVDRDEINRVFGNPALIRNGDRVNEKVSV